MTNIRKWMNLFENNSTIAPEEIQRRLQNSYIIPEVNHIKVKNGEIVYDHDIQVSKNINELVDVDFSVNGSFYIMKTNLLDLLNFPKSVIGDSLWIKDNPLLKSLNGIKYIKVNKFYISSNPRLQSLEGLDKNSEIKDLYISYSKSLPLLRTLFVTNIVYIRSRDGLVDSSYENIQNIINQHIQQYSDINERILRCKIALERAGYESNAKW